MSGEQIAFWEDAFAQATTRDEWQAELAANYWTHDFKGADGARAFLDGEYAFLQRMLRELGVASSGG